MCEFKSMILNSAGETIIPARSLYQEHMEKLWDEYNRLVEKALHEAYMAGFNIHTVPYGPLKRGADNV